MRWYTVHVYSSMEKSVQRSIIERIGRSELKDLFGEVLLPIEKVEETRNGRKIETERRMYPGYVFVEMVMTEETWHLVNSTPRVIEFLGNNHPVPLSDAEIAAIKDRMSVGTEKARPKIMFEPGEIVRIKEGPFQDFNGRVEEILYDKSRLRCFVSIFGRETSVELAFNEVEKDLIFLRDALILKKFAHFKFFWHNRALVSYFYWGAPSFEGAFEPRELISNG